jgi:processive 1,2-diacylglycerol beta-glucosyltransferase
MVKLYDKDTGAWLGTITEEQLQFLMDQLEEESSEDRDYYINDATLESFEEEGADPALIKVLRAALNGRTEMEIRWSRV